MKFVVTAGPTREPFDPVRFLSNRSSGKMGYALAEAALQAGHEVTLISGPVQIPAPKGAQFVAITTSEELYGATRRAVENCDVLVMCAAVADYKPTRVAGTKPKKKAGTFSLKLTPTRDILATLASGAHDYFVVGFAAETNDVEANARHKLCSKNCDIMVANDVSRNDRGMESDRNEVTIFFREGGSKTIAVAPKKIIARKLLKIILSARENSLTKKTC
ncbi:MAG: phosphopantothenoylcysteine decarboxylase [Chthoniobacterales bacterium]